MSKTPFNEKKMQTNRGYNHKQKIRAFDEPWLVFCLIYLSLSDQAIKITSLLRRWRNISILLYLTQKFCVQFSFQQMEVYRNVAGHGLFYIKLPRRRQWFVCSQRIGSRKQSSSWVKLFINLGFRYNSLIETLTSLKSAS